MPQVRYFAAAEEAAGTDAENRDETSLGELRDGILREHPALSGILDRCAVLVDGVRHEDDAALTAESSVDILPPFAGG